MKIAFYSVKLRKTIEVPVADCRKKRVERTTAAGKHSVRYAVEAVVDGVRLVKFVNQKTWDELDVPVVAASVHVKNEKKPAAKPSPKKG